MQNCIEMAIFVTLGSLLASFSNVVIYRGPSMWGFVDTGADSRGNLATPRSYCPNCKKTLRVWHLIPIFSFLIQGGHCHFCRSKISQKYLLVEVLGSVLGALVYVMHGFSIEALMLLSMFIAMIVLASIDFETGYLPDLITLPFIAVGLGFNAIHGFAPLRDAIIGALIGYCFITGVRWLFFKFRQMEGIGLGDAKLLAGIGAWAGWAILPQTIFIASMSTLMIVGVAQLQKANLDRTHEIPFGPGLAIAGAVSIALASIGWDIRSF